MIPLSFHVLSVLFFIPVRFFLDTGAQFKIFTSFKCFYLHSCIFSAEDDTFKNVNTKHPCDVIQVEGSHPST